MIRHLLIASLLICGVANAATDNDIVVTTIIL